MKAFTLILPCLVPLLMLSQTGCKKKDEGAAGAKPAAELILGKWNYERDKTIITLEFAAGKVNGKWKTDGSGPSLSGTYQVLDEKTLEIPKFDGGFEEKVKIDSISADKLVLSGFSYKPGSYEFTRPGATAAAPGGDNRLLWQHANGIFAKTGDGWVEKVTDGSSYQFVEKQRTADFVELYDNKGRECTVRLYKDHCTIKEGNGDFGKLYDGAWATASATPNPATANRDKLLGKWTAPKTNDFPFDITLEFGDDGKLKMVVHAAPKAITKEIDFKVEGDKIHTVRKEGGKEERDSWTITTLNDQQLIYVDGRGTTNTFKKKK